MSISDTCIKISVILLSSLSYLESRGLSSGSGPVVFPEPYGPAEREAAYKSFSFSGWGGSSGHDAPMIALDALLGAGSDWEELMSRGGFHGGQLFPSCLTDMPFF